MTPQCSHRREIHCLRSLSAERRFEVNPPHAEVLNTLPGMPLYETRARCGMPRRRIEEWSAFKVIHEPLHLLAAGDIVR